MLWCKICQQEVSFLTNLGICTKCDKSIDKALTKKKHNDLEEDIVEILSAHASVSKSITGGVYLSVGRNQFDNVADKLMKKIKEYYE